MTRDISKDNQMFRDTQRSSKQLLDQCLKHNENLQIAECRKLAEEDQTKFLLEQKTKQLAYRDELIKQ